MRLRPTFLLALILLVPGLALARPRIEKQTFSYIRSAGKAVAMSSVDHDGPQPKQPPLIPLPQARQHSAAACGLANAQMLCAYYNPEMPRGSGLAKQAKGYTYHAGTPTGGFLKLLRGLGFEAKAKRHMSLAELVGHYRQGTPVTIGAQAWAGRPVDWKTDTEDGHYMTVIGFGDWNGKPLTTAKQVRAAMKKSPDSAIVWLADPAMSTGRRGWMPVGEFLERWHWPGEKQLGVVVRPKHDTGARAAAFIPSSQRIR